MVIYLLFGISVALAVAKYISTSSSKVTYPPAGDYVKLMKVLCTSQSSNGISNPEMQSKFMHFIVDLGAHSQKNKGIGYFRLPNLTPAYVLSDSDLIDQLYLPENNSKFNQKAFFNRLALILGPDNLMSSLLKSNTHSQIRDAIFARNKMIMPKMGEMVTNFFHEYNVQQHTKNSTLSEVMDALSRRILLTTYFGEKTVEQFERIYNPELTKALMGCLFNLEPINNTAKTYILGLRQQIFNLARSLIFTQDLTQEILQKSSWLNHLLKVKIMANPNFKTQLESLNLYKSTSELNVESCQVLIQYAIDENNKNNLFAESIIDVVNESFFIPLLGFDATASTLIASLKMVLQNPRIYKIVQEELQQLKAAGKTLELHIGKDKPLSYIEAIIWETLRLSPPAPMIPEIVTQAIELQIAGETIVLNAGSILFIPLENIHLNSKNYPDIPLSGQGEEILGKKVIDANTFFPERWGPIMPNGKAYPCFSNDNFKPLKPYELEHQGIFLSFKKGPRSCPGKNLALTEILRMFETFFSYNFILDQKEKEKSELTFNYDNPLQRNGGQGKLGLEPVEENPESSSFTLS